MTHPDGITVDDGALRAFPNQIEHDPANIHEGRELAEQNDAVAIGLFYRNENADRYDEYTVQGIATTRAQKIEALREELQQYQV